MTGRSLPMGMVLLIVCLAGLVAAPGLAVEITVAGMGAANVVSGTAQINVTAPGAQDGYVVLKVDGEFVAAQAPPFGLVWNTRDVDDGQHEVAVHEVSADGQIVDRATEVVRVQNQANVTGTVTLQYKFQQGDEFTYVIEGRSDIRELQQDQSYELVPWTLYGAMAGNITAEASETVASMQAGSAVIDRTLTEGSVDFPEVVSRLRGVGLPTQFTVSPEGEVKDGPGTVNAESKFAAVWLGLPKGAVRQGQKWTSPLIAQFEVQDGRTLAVDADHEITRYTDSARFSRTCLSSASASPTSPSKRAELSGWRTVFRVSSAPSRPNTASTQSPADRRFPERPDLPPGRCLRPST